MNGLTFGNNRQNKLSLNNRLFSPRCFVCFLCKTRVFYTRVACVCTCV